jgi:hypothetical protein
VDSTTPQVETGLNGLAEASNFFHASPWTYRTAVEAVVHCKASPRPIAESLPGNGQVVALIARAFFQPGSCIGHTSRSLTVKGKEKR